MTSHPYQNAFDTAINELTDIAAKFEQLRARKEKIESLVQALQPFLGDLSQVQPQVSTTAHDPVSVAVPQIAASEAEPSMGYSFRDVPEQLPDASETGGDPFQRKGKATFRFRGLATQRS